VIKKTKESLMRMV